MHLRLPDESWWYRLPRAHCGARYGYSGVSLAATVKKSRIGATCGLTRFDLSSLIGLTSFLVTNEPEPPPRGGRIISRHRLAPPGSSDLKGNGPIRATALHLARFSNLLRPSGRQNASAASGVKGLQRRRFHPVRYLNCSPP
jgi:hypothetical protein